MIADSLLSIALPMHVVTVVGARPQFIKAAALSPALADAGIRETLVHTGQHYDANMSDVFFDELGMAAPRFALGIGSGTHGAQTGQMLGAVEAVLLDVRPDAMLVYGDTNSTLAGALAASKLGVPVAHVEAGLRSFDRQMPEEQNRVVTDHLSTWCFAPTDAAVANLAREGIVDGVHRTGDIMIDAVRRFAPVARARATIATGDSVLVTLHRAATTDDDATLCTVVDGLVALSARRPVVLPLHPRTRAALVRVGALARVEAHVRVVAPLGYLDLLATLHACALVVTDSGGLQKEAWAAGRPAVVLRDTTEWVELAETGWVHLLAPQRAAELPAVADAHLARERDPRALYGDGAAGRTIAGVLAAGLTAGVTA